MGSGLSGSVALTVRVHTDPNEDFAEQATSLAEAFSKTAASEVKMPFKSSLD
jgi:hypothetical protein